MGEITIQSYEVKSRAAMQKVLAKHTSEVEVALYCEKFSLRSGAQPTQIARLGKVLCDDFYNSMAPFLQDFSKWQYPVYTFEYNQMELCDDVIIHVKDFLPHIVEFMELPEVGNVLLGRMLRQHFENHLVVNGF